MPKPRPKPPSRSAAPSFPCSRASSFNPESRTRSATRRLSAGPPPFGVDLTPVVMSPKRRSVEWVRRRDCRQQRTLRFTLASRDSWRRWRKQLASLRRYWATPLATRGSARWRAWPQALGFAARAARGVAAWPGVFSTCAAGTTGRPLPTPTALRPDRRMRPAERHWRQV